MNIRHRKYSFGVETHLIVESHFDAQHHCEYILFRPQLVTYLEVHINRSLCGTVTHVL